LNVYGPSGDNTQKFTASYEGLPLDLTVCPGQGNNCVNAFVLDTTEAGILQPIFSPSLRVGLEANFSEATGGPDRLFLSNAAVAGPRAVPAPLIGHGLVALLAIGGVLAGSELLESVKKRLCA
jgi:hypothetical protein